MTNEIAIANAREDFKITKEDVRKYFAPNATEKEFGILMGICNSYKLNPFKREVHFVKYGNSPASIIVGYEIYLKRAERTGKLDGWNCRIEDMGKPTERAVIEIKRKDQSMPIVWEVFRKEFDRQQSTWKAMPTFMLKKVAIAQGFRMAFPDDLGGLPYIAEEMPHDKGGGSSEALPKYEEPVEVVEAVPVAEDDAPPFDEPFENLKPISEAQQKRLFARAKASGWPTAELKAYLIEVHGITSTKDIPLDRYDKIIEWIDTHDGYTSKEDAA